MPERLELPHSPNRARAACKRWLSCGDDLSSDDSARAESPVRKPRWSSATAPDEAPAEFHAAQLLSASGSKALGAAFFLALRSVSDLQGRPRADGIGIGGNVQCSSQF